MDLGEHWDLYKIGIVVQAWDQWEWLDRAVIPDSGFPSAALQPTIPQCGHRSGIY